MDPALALEGLLWELYWFCTSDRLERDGKDFHAQLLEAGAAENEAIYDPDVVAENREARAPLAFDTQSRSTRF